MVLLLDLSSGIAQLQRWVAEDEAGFSQALLDGVQLHPNRLLILDAFNGDENLAFGRKVVDEFNKEVPLSDGSIALQRSEWVSGTPAVFGRHFTVDLGFDRAITRVRILAGETAVNQPEFFVRGYRLEAATQQRPTLWRQLAEKSLNTKLNIDTSADSTWEVTDATGQPTARIGRFVKLTIIRQDRSNWIALGEIEVAGVGFVEKGHAVAEFTASQPVNVGRIRWREEVPAQTRLQLQVRGTQAGEDLAVWNEGGVYKQAETLFNGAEPVTGVQYRAFLETQSPLISPALNRLEIDYDPVLVAGRVVAQVEPDTVRKGQTSAVNYALDIQVAPGDYGVDMIRVDGAPLSIYAFRLNGLLLEEGIDFTWAPVPSKEGVLIELAERLTTSARAEIAAQALFLFDTTALKASVGSRTQETRDGYLNWQNARQAPGATWTVRALGAPPDLLGRVEISPRPFSPLQHNALAFNFVVGNLEEASPIALEIFGLAGRPVRKLVEEGRARAYSFLWDGRDENGRTVAPGLYLYQIRLDLGESSVKRRGTLVVAY